MKIPPMIVATLNFAQLQEILSKKDIICAYGNPNQNNWHRQILILHISHDKITIHNAPHGETYSISPTSLIVAYLHSEGISITFYDDLAYSDANLIPITMSLLVFTTAKPKKIRKLILKNA